MKKGVLRNFTKLTGKRLCQCLFFNKLAGLRPAPLLNKRLWRKCFPVNFVKFLRTLFYRTPLDDCFWKKRSSIVQEKNARMSQTLKKSNLYHLEFKWGIHYMG